MRLDMIVLVGLALLAGCKAHRAPPSGETATAPSQVEPWETVDPAFKGCEGG